jgi:hypothetical protein
MLQCISQPSATLDAFSLLAAADISRDMRAATQRKSSTDILTSTRAYLKSCVLGSVTDGSGSVTTSNVALDNKIEQAMDLVKSHLMFAVREEVEILKEQIKSLVAKNSRLEYENAILRESASPETLAQLQAFHNHDSA